MSTHKIVLVEDDQVLRYMYELKLKHHGFTVHTATNGEEGLAAIKESNPHLILLDLRMPVMTGDEMLKKLREEAWGASIRVIILTNLSKNEAPPSLRFLNVDRYVVKAHTTPSQVVEIIHQVLGTIA